MKEREKNSGPMKISRIPLLKGQKTILRRALPRLFMMVLVIILAPMLCLAEDIYIGQNAAGNDDGASCASAHSASWFNTPANWGSGAVKISAGDTVHLCGTIGTALWAQGSGSAGAPITIYFEPGASITPSTFCDGNGCLNLVNKSFIIVDGGSSCGYVNQVDTACNGTIRNTNVNPSSSSFGIVADRCANCEFLNLTIGPLCDPRTGGCGGDQRGIQNLGGVPNGSTWKVHNNVISYTGSAIVYVPGANDNGLQVHNNSITNINSSVDISNNNNGTMIAASIHNNHFGSTAIFDGAGCPGHHNSLHAFAKPGSNGGTNSGIDYYNNLIDGYWGNCATSGLFIEGGEYGANRNVRVFNNLFLLTYDQMNNGIVSLNGDGPLAFYNNTVIGTGAKSDVCFFATGDGKNTSISFQNNIITGCNTLVGTKDIAIADWDYNLYSGSLVWTNQSIPKWYNTLADWRSACNCDSHSLANSSSTYSKVNSLGRLQAGSPAINAGANLDFLGIAPLNLDFNGVSRPQGSAWDMGAFEFPSGSIPAPKNLRIVQ